MAAKPFRGWQAGMRALVEGGAWRWALAIGFAIAFGGGVWAYDVFGSEIRTLWPTWKAEGGPRLRETLLWIEFAASITLTVAVLCWFTALLFCLLCALLFGLLKLFDRFSSLFFPHRDPGRVRHTIDDIWQQDRLWGTILNLLASLGALAGLSKLLDRSLDHWDIGIQILISAAIELIVLQMVFSQGRLR